MSFFWNWDILSDMVTWTSTEFLLIPKWETDCTCLVSKSSQMLCKSWIMNCQQKSFTFIEGTDTILLNKHNKIWMITSRNDQWKPLVAKSQTPSSSIASAANAVPSNSMGTNFNKVAYKVECCDSVHASVHTSQKPILFGSSGPSGTYKCPVVIL